MSTPYVYAVVHGQNPCMHNHVRRIRFHSRVDSKSLSLTSSCTFSESSLICFISCSRLCTPETSTGSTIDAPCKVWGGVDQNPSEVKVSSCVTIEHKHLCHDTRNPTIQKSRYPNALHVHYSSIEYAISGSLYSFSIFLLLFQFFVTLASSACQSSPLSLFSDR